MEKGDYAPSKNILILRTITVELTRLSNLNFWGTLRSFVGTELILGTFWRRVDVSPVCIVAGSITKWEFVAATAFVLTYAVVTPGCRITVRIVLETAGG